MKYDPAGRLIEQQVGAIAHAIQKDRQFQPHQYRPDVRVGMQAAILRRYRYDRSSQLTSIDDSRRGHIEYRYYPVGRLLATKSILGHETFAFDPAHNIQVPDTTNQVPISRRPSLPKLLDNLLKNMPGSATATTNRVTSLRACRMHSTILSNECIQSDDARHYPG